MSLFKKATLEGFKLRLALTGPSGSGKTYSALTIAKELGDKIALVDTENGSAALYSERFNFDIAQMHEPYQIQKYLKVMQQAAESGYDVLIIDSLSHAWIQLLKMKESLDSRGGNSFANWSKVTPQHEMLKDAILHPKFHLICTMRSKQAYAMEENDKGKTAPKKVGLAPVQREGMEYEFDLCLDFAMDHSALASKDRSGLFSTGEPFMVNKETGLSLKKWVGATPALQQTTPPDEHEIVSQVQYDSSIKEVDALIGLDPPKNSPKGQRLHELTGLIERYEKKMGFMEKKTTKPLPENNNGAVDAITQNINKVIESKGLSRDLVDEVSMKFIGKRFGLEMTREEGAMLLRNLLNMQDFKPPITAEQIGGDHSPPHPLQEA